MKSSTRGGHDSQTLGLVALAIGAAWVGSVWIVLAVAVGLITVGAGLRAWTPVREAATRHRFRQRRDLRLRGCVGRLEEAGVSEERVRALKALGLPVGQTNDELVERFPIDELLDGYADLEIERHLCVRVLTNVSRNDLVLELGSLTHGDEVDRQQRATVELRLRTWDACRDRAHQCERQIAVISGIIRAIEIRAAVPAPAAGLEWIQPALDDLEHDDAALAEVSALELPAAAR